MGTGTRGVEFNGPSFLAGIAAAEPGEGVECFGAARVPYKDELPNRGTADVAAVGVEVTVEAEDCAHFSFAVAFAENVEI